MKAVIQNKLMKLFLRNTGNEGAGDLVPLKPEHISGWIFPLFAGIIALVIAALWYIHHPEIVTAKAVFTKPDLAARIFMTEIDIPQNNTYTIDSGQLVQLHFYDYPVSRYGVVEGRLLKVSAINKNTIVAGVQLPRGLVTTRQKHIRYKESLKADMLIFTKDMRLLQRIFYKSARGISPDN